MSNEYNNTWYNDDYNKSIEPEKVKPVREKKKHTTVWVIALSVFLSSTLGFCGGMFASRLGQGEKLGPSVSNPINNEIREQAISITAEQLAAADSSAFNAAAVAAVGTETVVEITTEVMTRDNIIMGQYVSKGAGSGVIIGEDGYIATNAHVIEGASKITVRTRAGDEYSASIIGSDEETDLAVIKVEANGLKTAALGVSENLVVGQRVLAVGNPLGELGGTVTEGIISALDREVDIEGRTMTLLQTDASVNPGNSGGGLFDGSGALVGIVNAKSSGSGIEGLGFAIPIDTARVVIDELIANGYVTGRVELGVELAYIDEQAAYLYRLGDGGVYISSIVSGSAAEKAGLQVGDRIIKIEDKKIDSPSSASSQIKRHKVGDKITILIERKNEEMKIEVVLGEQKPTIAPLF